ncbi:hypothetical protein C8R48DRAFT_267204 [Suillus tomentosus]|nr:hypothetical protein C8R48DRAFT_267204 [Suillus tomentosus]
MEILTLILDLIVTLCTESIGFVHGISLRSALASESRLRFSTNLRLLTAARGWYNPNGTLFNGISAVDFSFQTESYIHVRLMIHSRCTQLAVSLNKTYNFHAIYCVVVGSSCSYTIHTSLGHLLADTCLI